MPYLVLQWLNSVVRPETDSDRNNRAEAKHISLYANALTRIGSYKEAEVLLKKIKPDQDSQVYFYFALLEMQQWNNLAASRYLKKFLETPKLPEYNIKIGKLNLAATLSSIDEYEESLDIIEDLLKEVPPNSLLRANLLEIKGQNLFHLEQFLESQKSLEESISIFQNSSNTYRYYAEKWLMLNQVFNLKSPYAKNISYLEEFKNRALIAKQWEVVRDCDFFKCYLSNDEDLLFKIYFGTRFKYYNQRILKYFGFYANVPKQFNLTVGPITKDSQLVNLKLPLIFDRGQGAFSDNFQQILDKLPLKLFQLLTSDIYQPFHLGEIFSVIYENEYFNPHTSPQKLSRLIFRLRDVLEKNNLPIRVLLYNKQVRLSYLEPVIFKIKKNEKKITFLDEYIKIKDHFPEHYFNVHEVEKLLNISNRTAKRILQKLVTERLVYIQKQGPQTRYRIIKSSKINNKSA